MYLGSKDLLFTLHFDYLHKKMLVSPRVFLETSQRISPKFDARGGGCTESCLEFYFRPVDTSAPFFT
jgi:hypothetical protein